jgi:starch synthase
VDRSALNVLMIASEAVPWSGSGDLAEAAGALPAALARFGHSVTLVLPRYRATVVPPGALHTRRVRLGAIDLDVQLHVASIAPGRRIVLVDVPALYNRAGVYGEQGQEYADNAIRFATLSVAALDYAVDVPDDRPFDIVHAHDWQAGLAPVLVRTHEPFAGPLGEAGLVFTIHDIACQGRFPRDVVPMLGLPWSTFSMDRAEFWGDFSFLKAGITFSDYVTTVSPRYAHETQQPGGGAGLEGVLALRSGRYVGILNGIDTEVWNPATDALLPANFSPHDLAGKAVCKRALLDRSALSVGDDALARPLVGFASPLRAEKGLDLIAEAAGRLLALDATWIFAGAGESRYEGLLRELAASHKTRLAVHEVCSAEIEHLIYAGADMVLVPSRSEPCGRAQMLGLRYGAVPVVTAVGGLDDTVRPYTARARRANGFKLRVRTPDALVRTLRQAIRLYHDRPGWRQLVRLGMGADLSWQTAGREYGKVYRRARAVAAIRGGL